MNRNPLSRFPRKALLGGASAAMFLGLTAIGGTSCTSAPVAGVHADASVDSAAPEAASTADDGTQLARCNDASPNVLPLVDAAQCVPGQLVAPAPITIVTPDPNPSHLTLAASPSGDRFLAAWTDGGGILDNVAIPETLWASLLLPGSDGAANSTPIELAGNGMCPIAAWNGADFTVVWGDDSGLRSQEIDLTGAAVGSPAQVLSKANTSACPASLVAAAGGLAVAWYEGQSSYTESVGLIGAGGAVGTPVLLDDVGSGVSPDVALAQLQGRTYAAFVEWPDGSASTTVSAIDWSQGTVLPGTVQAGYFASFLAAGDELWLTADISGSMLFVGAPGSPFRLAGQLCDYDSVIATDGCGRLVELGAQAPVPAGFEPGFNAQPLGWASATLPLGSVTQAAIAGAATTFGVIWYVQVGPPVFFDEPMTGTLSFTTLSWQAL